MNKALLVILLFWGGNGLFAQDTLFAYANAPGEDPFAPRQLTGMKYEIARGVFDDLIRARGDRRKAAPRLVMNTGRQYIAWMHPGRAEVGLEERAYEVCRSFGRDSLAALAALLAHELTHYYENHDWTRNFVNSNEGLEVSARMAEREESLKFEVQADYLGGILAISAGYDSYGVLPDFLRQAYRAYGFAEGIPGYPSLSERIKIAENTAESLKEYHTIYQTANLLTLVEAYEPALSYYEFMLNSFQSYEVYNNAGVCALLAVLKLTDPEEMPFALPLELDPSSRLDRLATRLPDRADARRAELLRRAHTYLQNATDLTEKEAVGYLNRSIAFVLSGEYFDAAFWATKAQRVALLNGDEKTGGDVRVLQGIIAALEGKQAEAALEFRAARAKSPLLAERNLAYLEGRQPAPAAFRPAPVGVEKIDGVLLTDFLDELPDLDRTVEVTPRIFCGRKNFLASTILLHYADDGAAYAGFQRTASYYDEPSAQGTKIGASLSDVTGKYGQPDRILGLRNGSVLRYETAGLLFEFNASNQLTGWLRYVTEL